MKKHWWKALGVIILAYTFIAGILIPLKPGVAKVNPSSGRTGEVLTLKVVGYNSNYEKASDSVRAWLKLDNEKALSASAVKVKNDRELEIGFQIPEYLPVKERVQVFSLILDNKLDGASVLPNAVFVTQDSIDPEMGLAAWKNSSISNLNEQSGITFPFRNILSETIRNTYFHVPLWFGMIIIFIISVVYSWRYLQSKEDRDDWNARAFTTIGLGFGLFGLITGAIWAKHTWGAYWSFDIKQNMTAIALLIYSAYFILRGSFNDPEKKGRLAAIYNIFAFAALIPLIYVIPRLTDSLHPGAGGNPAFGGEDLDNTMRMVFYPAIIGWTLLGVWMANLLFRTFQLEEKLWEREMR